MFGLLWLILIDVIVRLLSRLGWEYSHHRKRVELPWLVLVELTVNHDLRMELWQDLVSYVIEFY